MARRALNQFLAGLDGSDELVLTPEQEDAMAWWREHPWHWLTGTWPLKATKTREPRPIIWTKDEWDREVPVKHFPNWDYLRYGLIEPIYYGEGTFAVDKARQVLCSTAILLLILYEILHLEARRWLISKNKRDEATALMRDKQRFAIKRMPKWMNAWYGVRPKPAGFLECPRTDSYCMSVARNFGQREGRGGTGDVFIDEAVLLDQFREALRAAQAQARRTVCVSTPDIAGDSAAAFVELLDGRQPNELMAGVPPQVFSLPSPLVVQ